MNEKNNEEIGSSIRIGEQKKTENKCDSHKYCCSIDVEFGWMPWVIKHNLRTIDEVITELNSIDEITIFRN